MKLRAIGLALAVTCVVAAGGPALAQYVMAPPGAPMMPPGGPMAPPNGGMMPPGGAMTPRAPMMPGGALPPPGGPMMPPGGLMGGYPGMPYPAAPMDGCGCAPSCGCAAPCGCGESCGCCESCCGEEGCLDFGRGGGCGCECCCEPDGTAHWRARFETVLLKFNLPHEPVVLSTNAAGEALLGIGSLGFDNELSGRLSLEARLPCDDSVELVFLGIPHWNDSAATLDPAGGLFSPYQSLNGADVDPYDNALQHDISYVSRLWSFEANYWKPLLCAGRFQSSAMVGARFLRVSEDFIYSAVSAAGGGTFGTTDVNTANDIPALQIGIMASASLAHHVSFRFDGKFGIGYNFAEQSTDILVTTVNGAGNVNYSEHVGSQKGAFLGQLSAVLTWQLNCYVAFHAGYQALWLDDLALAPENFNSTFPTDGFRPVLIQDNSNRFYHGALAGVEITW